MLNRWWRAGKFSHIWPKSPRFALVYLLSATACFGALGNIGGSVTDPAEAVVPGAEVILLNEETGLERKTLTDASGYYVFPLLAPGSYRIAVTAQGFLEATREAIQLRVDDALRIDIPLTIQGKSTSVDVRADLILLNTDTATRGLVVSAREVEQLPLNERNFLTLALLAPGVTPPTYGSYTAKQGGAIHVSGGREQSNMFLLDGSDNSNPLLNLVSLSPPIAAIDQFKIQSANSSADFGRMSSGQIDVALKSGTNLLHGSVFGFLRNRNFDARNFFDLPPCRPGLAPGQCAADKAALDRTQFGGSIGGPLVKDRAFFFAAYEGLRLRQGNPRQSTVPSINQRAEAISRVPAAERSAAGLATLNLYPLPNVDPTNPTSNAYVASPLTRESIDQALVKVDYQLSENVRLTGHYGVFDRQRTEPYDTSSNFTTLPGYGVRATPGSESVAAGLTQTPTPYLALDTRFAWHSPRILTVPQNQGRDFNATLGYPTLAANPDYLGFPSVLVAGFSAIGEGRGLPSRSASDVWNVTHNATLQKAMGRVSHLLQFGGSFRSSRTSYSAPLYPRGYWTFTGGFGATPLENLVRGRPSLVLVGRGDSALDLTTWSASLYVSDNVHIGRSLTLQAGLRYEFNRPPTNTGTPLTVPDTRPESANCSPKPVCLLVPGAELGLPASTFYSDRNNFGPRIGLSWRPPALNRMVVRSAYGIFYDNASLSQMTPYSLNPPFLSLLSYANDGSRTIQTSVGGTPRESLAVAYRMDPNLRDGYVQQWNLSLQFELAQGWLFETAYVGSKGTHLPGSTDPNQPPEGGGPRPFPQHGPILSIESRASSNYNAMQIYLERRLRAGTSLRAAYTWSKSIDDASLYAGLAQAESYTPQDSSTRQGERALSTFNTAHRLSVMLLQKLPSLAGQTGLVRGLLGGWQVAMIGSFNSGHPFPILRQVDQSATGFGPLGDASDRPDVVGDPMQAGPVLNNPDPACHATTAQGGRAAVRVREPGSWFNPCAFAAPDTPRFGNSARNNVIGPGIANVDASIVKYIPFLSERYSLQLRVEAFNVLNTPHFDLPEHHFDSARFGAISSSNALGTAPPRQIQLAVQLQF